MTQSIGSALDQEVGRFNAWAGDRGPGRSGEWECDYPDWNVLYKAASDLIGNSDVHDWNESIVGALIYAIARDNECGCIASLLRAETGKLCFLARAALRSEEADAKWQLSVQLAHSSVPFEDAEPLLLSFATDDDEYVRRQALMALGRIRSSHVELLAEKAWETGDEYQRMASLAALSDVHSQLLPLYLELAHADGRRYLAAYADRILKVKWGRLPPADHEGL